MEIPEMFVSKFNFLKVVSNDFSIQRILILKQTLNNRKYLNSSENLKFVKTLFPIYKNFQ